MGDREGELGGKGSLGERNLREEEEGTEERGKRGVYSFRVFLSCYSSVFCYMLLQRLTNS